MSGFQLSRLKQPNRRARTKKVPMRVVLAKINSEPVALATVKAFQALSLKQQDERLAATVVVVRKKIGYNANSLGRPSVDKIIRRILKGD